MAQRLYRRISLWDKEIVQTTTSYWDGLCKSKSSMKTVSLGSNPSKTTMIIAVYELNGRVLKTTNLKKKLKKVKPDKILFSMEFEGSIREAEAILDDWIREDEEDDNEYEGWKASIYKRDGTSYHSISLDRILEFYNPNGDFLWYDGCVV